MNNEPTHKDNHDHDHDHHQEVYPQAKSSGLSWKQSVFIGIAIVVLGGILDSMFLHPKDQGNSTTTTALEATVKGWQTQFSKALETAREELEKTSALQVKASQDATAKAQADYESVKKKLETGLEESAKASKASASASALALAEVQKAVDGLTKKVDALTLKVTTPPQAQAQQVATAIPQPVVVATEIQPSVTSATGLPPTNVSTARGPGPRSFSSAVVQNDRSLSDGLRRIAAQETVHLDKAQAMKDAARALDSQIKVSQTTANTLKVIALGLEKAQLIRDAAVVREALQYVQ